MSELQGIARFKFHEGKVEESKRLSAQAMEIVRMKDTGTLRYDIYFNDDQSECIVLERFRDSEALIGSWRAKAARATVRPPSQQEMEAGRERSRRRGVISGERA